MRKWFGICMLGWCLAWTRVQGAPATALIFSPDGNNLISNGPAIVRIHSALDGEIKETIPSPIRRISSVAFSPTGRWLAVAGGTPALRGELAIMDWETRRTVYHITNSLDLNTRVEFNVDGKLVAASSADHKVTIYQIEPEGFLFEPVVLSGHTGPVLALAFDPFNSNLVTAGADRSLKVWSKEGKLLRTMSYHTEAVNALAFRPALQGKQSECASGSDDGSIRIWQPGIGRMVRIIRNPGVSVLALAYRPNGSTLFSADNRGIISEIDASSDRFLQTIPTGQDWIFSICINNTGDRVTTGDWNGTVRTRTVTTE